MNTQRYVKDKKGINTILASLLMVVIVVVAAVMVYAWSTGLLGTLLVKPNTGEGPLSPDSSVFSNPTNVTIYIRNSGSSDRKSTRLNSSHLGISYAVFCLKKKKQKIKMK